MVETKIMNKEYKMDEDDNMSTSSDELSGNDLIDNEQDDCVTDQQYCDDKQSDEELLFELIHQQEQAIEQLSAVFQLLKMAPIHDK